MQARDEGVGLGEYVNADGVRTYYEVYGEGETIVMLHGGLATRPRAYS